MQAVMHATKTAQQSQPVINHHPKLATVLGHRNYSAPSATSSKKVKPHPARLYSKRQPRLEYQPQDIQQAVICGTLQHLALKDSAPQPTPAQPHKEVPESDPATITLPLLPDASSSDPVQDAEEAAHNLESKDDEDVQMEMEDEHAPIQASDKDQPIPPTLPLTPPPIATLTPPSPVLSDEGYCDDMEEGEIEDAMEVDELEDEEEPGELWLQSVPAYRQRITATTTAAASSSSPVHAPPHVPAIREQAPSPPPQQPPSPPPTPSPLAHRRNIFLDQAQRKHTFPGSNTDSLGLTIRGTSQASSKKRPALAQLQPSFTSPTSPSTLPSTSRAEVLLKQWIDAARKWHAQGTSLIRHPAPRRGRPTPRERAYSIALSKLLARDADAALGIRSVRSWTKGAGELVEFLGEARGWKVDERWGGEAVGMMRRIEGYWEVVRRNLQGQ
ncbi:hypothetical protein BDW22DRAFT_532968 [Trametopsis cervina]|nr:hypothetical protein BDW22DRAFT_532968 [Trametopsis cervina]